MKVIVWFGKITRARLRDGGYSCSWITTKDPTEMDLVWTQYHQRQIIEIDGFAYVVFQQWKDDKKIQRLKVIRISLGKNTQDFLFGRSWNP